VLQCTHSGTPVCLYAALHMTVSGSCRVEGVVGMVKMQVAQTHRPVAMGGVLLLVRFAV
jgi:hypothetical protein